MKRFLLLSLLLCSTQVFSCPLKIAIRDAAHYSSKDNNGDWHGIDIEIYKYLANAISCDIEYVTVPFLDAIKLLKAGEIDAMTQLSILPDRINDISFVGPVRREIFSLVTTPEVTEKISSYDDIAKYSYVFAKRKGTYLGSEFHQRYAKDESFSTKFIELTMVHPRINLILKKRIHGFFDESTYLDYAMEHLPEYQGLTRHALIINNGDVYIGFSKKSLSAKTLKKINDAFSVLKKSNKISDLHAYPFRQNYK